MTRIPLYSTVFLCRGDRRRADRPSAGDAATWAGSPRTTLPAMTVGVSQWGAHAFAAIRGEPVPVLFDPPRSQPWHGA